MGDLALFVIPRGDGDAVAEAQEESDAESILQTSRSADDLELVGQSYMLDRRTSGFSATEEAEDLESLKTATAASQIGNSQGQSFLTDLCDVSAEAARPSLETERKSGRRRLGEDVLVLDNPFDLDDSTEEERTRSRPENAYLSPWLGLGKDNHSVQAQIDKETERLRQLYGQADQPIPQPSQLSVDSFGYRRMPVVPRRLAEQPKQLYSQDDPAAKRRTLPKPTRLRTNSPDDSSPANLSQTFSTGTRDFPQA